MFDRLQTQFEALVPASPHSLGGKTLKTNPVRLHALWAAVLPLAQMFVPVPAMAATVIGSAVTVRSNIDGAAGQVYVYAGGHFDSGLKMSTMTWNSGVAGRIITPILLEETNTSTHVYTVRGVGSTRTS